MLVRFYQNTKRNRSTALPTGQYKEVDVKLKDMTSITSPTLLLSSFAPVFYNYVEIMEWSRYYFISNTASVEGMWEVSLTEDYLASFRAYILNTNANILYATGSTKSIVDSRIPVKSTVSIGHNYAAIPKMTITEGSGAVILGITGKGSLGAYLMQNSTLISELLDGIDSWSSFINDNWTFTKQLFFGGSASECLRSAIALPLVIGGDQVSAGTAEDLNLGNYPCMDNNGNSIKGYKITKPIISFGDTINIPWQSSDWKKVAAYSSIKMYFPFIGIITLPATELQDDSTITYHYSLNVTSGDISLEVYGTTSKLKVATASGNCAMPTAFGSTGINTSKLTTAAATGLGALVAISAASATGGLSFLAEAAIGGAIGSTALQTMEALGGTGQGSAGLGGGSSQGLDKVVHIFVIQKELSASQNSFDPIMGKPFMEVDLIGNHRGFVQTDGFQLSSDFAYSAEKDQVNKLMDSGVYIE